MFTKLYSYGQQVSSFTNMSCEACSVKFTLFKRKRQCMDCLHYFCTGCVIRRRDKVLCCDNCSMLSRRPLIKSQIIQMRTRHLRNYLEAKKVNIKGCVEKDDLVNLLILYVNKTDRTQWTPNFSDNSGYRNSGSNDRPTYFESSRINSDNNPRENVERRNESREDFVNEESNSSVPENQEQAQVQEAQVPIEQNPASVQEDGPEVPDPTRTEDCEEARESVSDEPQPAPEESQELEPSVMIVEDADDLEEPRTNAASDSVQIEEVIEADIELHVRSEPVITEFEDTEVTRIQESAAIFTEIKTWPDNLKLSDIEVASDLNQLGTKQLKYLLLANRVDFKGCVERYELMDRVLRLWTEYQQSRKEAESSDMDVLCKICLDAPIECVILECGHMACCIDCGKKMAECPICRQYIVRVVRIFRS